MKKALFLILISASFLTFSNFGFGDNPKVIYAKEGRKLKIQSHSKIQKLKIGSESNVLIPNVASEEIEQSKISFLSKVLITLKFIVAKFYLLIFK
jgi:hypothetical protein